MAYVLVDKRIATSTDFHVYGLLESTELFQISFNSIVKLKSFESNRGNTSHSRKMMIGFNESQKKLKIYVDTS